MEIGMLWFDDSARPLKDKVLRAVEYYAKKYGRSPTLCLVNPAGLNGGAAPVEGVQIRGARTVMPNHLWVGVDEQAEAKRPVRKTACTASRRKTRASGQARESEAPESRAA
jgi:hypothetical protein